MMWAAFLYGGEWHGATFPIDAAGDRPPAVLFVFRCKPTCPFGHCDDDVDVALKHAYGGPTAYRLTDWELRHDGYGHPAYESPAIYVLGDFAVDPDEAKAAAWLAELQA